MFPITSERRFFYTVQGDPYWAANTLRDYLFDRLAREGAKHIAFNGKRIEFDGRMWEFDIFRWHFLHGISKGRITVDCRDTRVGVAYQISFIGHGVYLALFFVWWALGFVFFPGMSFFGALPYLGMLSFGFVLLFAVNTAVTRYRFKWFVEDRLREFFNSPSIWGVHGKSIASR